MTKTSPRAKQSDREVWRVGVLFSRSGLMAVTESEHFFGTALAIEEINKAGGILGREIEVIAYDPGSAPETFRKMADRLLTEDGASIIFGYNDPIATPLVSNTLDAALTFPAGSVAIAVRLLENPGPAVITQTPMSWVARA